MKFSHLASGLGWTEGPVCSAHGGVFVTSMDQGSVFRIDGDKVTRYVAGGVVNGATEDARGRLYLAQEGGNWPGTRVDGIPGGVQVLDTDGAIHWVTQDPIAPNDICFGPDGLLYLTDPTRNRASRDDGRLWRVDPVTGTARILTSVPWYPNGIGFGLDDLLYVASTADRRIIRFDVSGDSISPGETFATATAGGPDGFAFDVEGNLLLCCVGDEGVAGHMEVWSPDGEFLERIEPGPDRLYTNVAIDGEGRLVVTDARFDGGVLLGDRWRLPGLPLHPFRDSSAAEPALPASMLPWAS